MPPTSCSPTTTRIADRGSHLRGSETTRRTPMIPPPRRGTAGSARCSRPTPDWTDGEWVSFRPTIASGSCLRSRAGRSSERRVSSREAPCSVRARAIREALRGWRARCRSTKATCRSTPPPRRAERHAPDLPVARLPRPGASWRLRPAPRRRGRRRRDRELHDDGRRPWPGSARIGSGFDVLFPVDGGARRPRRRGTCSGRLTHELLPNGCHLWPFFLGHGPFYDPGQRYSVPYTVYSTGIGWRRDLVAGSDDAPGTWPNPYDAFWNERYRGCRRDLRRLPGGDRARPCSVGGATRTPGTDPWSRPGRRRPDRDGRTGRR